MIIGSTKPILSIKSNYFFWFIIALLINAFGSSITVVATLGTGPWIALSENLSISLGIYIGTATIIIQVILFFVACYLTREFSFLLIIKSIVISLSYGFLVDFFMLINQSIYIPSNLAVKIIYFIVGVILVLIGVSIYIRLNIALMPFDMLLRALMIRLKSVKYASWTFLSIPIALSLILSLVNGKLIGVGVGTFICLVINPYLLDLLEKLIYVKRKL